MRLDKMFLTKFATRKGQKKVIESDHHTIISDFEIRVEQCYKKIRKEFYNLRNPDNCQKFYHATNTTKLLTECFKGGNIKTEGNKWKRNLTTLIGKCFKKFRITNKTKSTKLNNIDTKLNERSQLKNSIAKETNPERKEQSIEKLEESEAVISEECAKMNIESLREQVGQLCNIEGGFNTLKMWKVKQKVLPRPREPPQVKEDSSGNLITSPEMLLRLYLETFVDRLRKREMSPGLEDLESLRLKLFNYRLEYAKNNISPPFQREKLEKVLKSLKKGKTRDPHGFTNEIF